MKKTCLLFALFCTFLSACDDKKDAPVPQTPPTQQQPTAKLEGKWQLYWANIRSTGGDEVTWANSTLTLDFVPGSSVLNYYEQGSLKKTGTYTLKNKVLTVSLDSIFQPNQTFTLDSLSLNKVVLRDTILYPTNDYYYFTYRLKR